MSAIDTTDPKEAPVETAEYRIVVTKIQHNVKFRDKSYEDLGTTKKDSYGNDEKEYGYVYSDGYKTVTTEIYDQTVADLNIGQVIKAVNKMEQ